jgi:aspartoacylase
MARIRLPRLCARLEPLSAARVGMVEQAGARGRVLVVAGTHGNERNAPWLLEAWRRHEPPLATAGLAVDLALGNPAAYAANRRYISRDLNRSFVVDRLAGPERDCPELEQARALLGRHGPQAPQPCQVVFDLHSTTAAMGNCLVVYGRRPADLALAAALQGRLGLPVYLHEADSAQTGYLVERWPCGLVVEVGPVPQGVIAASIARQTALALEEGFACLAAARDGSLRLPPRLVVHRHLGSLDLPRDAAGESLACLHPARQHRDWRPLRAGDPLFLTPAGATLPYRPPAGQGDRPVWPVFINEAAYGEKGIALSLCEREVWPLHPGWAEALAAVAAALEPA